MISPTGLRSSGSDIGTGEVRATGARGKVSDRLGEQADVSIWLLPDPNPLRQPLRRTYFAFLVRNRTDEGVGTKLC
jgi:hypothetical protein